MASLNDYTLFFENIARNHVDIGHTDNEKHFCRMELEEVIGGMQSGAHFRLLVMETYEFGFTDKDSDNTIKSRVCGFMLLDKPKSINNFNERAELLSDLESNVDDILKLMVQLKGAPYNHAVLYDFDINTVNVMPIMNGPDGSCGFRVVFDSKGRFDPEVDDTKWLTTEF